MRHHLAIGELSRRFFAVAVGLAGMWGSHVCADTPQSPRADVARLYEGVRLPAASRVAFPDTVALEARLPATSAITPVELLARARTTGARAMPGAANIVGIALAAPARGVSGDPVTLVSTFPLVSPGLPPAFSSVSLAVPQLPSTSISPCALAVPIRLDQARAPGPVEPSAAARVPPMAAPVALARPTRSVSPALPVLKCPGQGEQWPKSSPLFRTVGVALSRCRCDPDKLDELLVANYRTEIQALAATGKREEVAATALHLLNVVSSTDARRYAFETIMGASGLKRAKPQNAVAVFLARFAAQSPDLQRRALLFAASWCYEQEAYSLALAKVAEVKALPDNGVDIVAVVLMTEGLCRVRLNEPRAALAAFGAVVKDCGGTELAPKAQFLIGWLYLSNQENKKARAALQQVVKSYPKTEYATRAQRLLNTM